MQGHLVGVAQAGLLATHAAAVGHELEQAAQGEVEVFALARLLGGQGLEFEVAQALQAVAFEVDLAFVDGHIAQLGPRLDVEHEQQAVHHAQAFEAEHAGVELVLARVHAFFAAAGLFVELAGGFVTQQLNGFAQGVFQILADAKGVFVGVFVQALQQAVAFAGGQAVLVQERGAGFEGVGVFAVEDVGPVEAQGAVVGPFVAVEQQPFVQAQQQHVARGLVGAKHGV